MPWIALLLLAAGCGGAQDDRATPAAPEPERPAGPTIDQLRAMGYAGETEEVYEEDLPPVVVTDEARVSPGYNVYATEGVVDLVDLEGEVLKEWRHERFQWKRPRDFQPDGEFLLFAKRGGHAAGASLVRLRWHGRPVWRLKLPVHHDVEFLPDGRMWSPVTGEADGRRRGRALTAGGDRAGRGPPRTNRRGRGTGVERDRRAVTTHGATMRTRRVLLAATLALLALGGSGCIYHHHHGHHPHPPRRGPWCRLSMGSEGGSEGVGNPAPAATPGWHTAMPFWHA